jgi:hypothetical protein
MCVQSVFHQERLDELNQIEQRISQKDQVGDMSDGIWIIQQFKIIAD